VGDQPPLEDVPSTEDYDGEEPGTISNRSSRGPTPLVVVEPASEDSTRQQPTTAVIKLAPAPDPPNAPSSNAPSPTKQSKSKRRKSSAASKKGLKMEVGSSTTTAASGTISAPATKAAETSVYVEPLVLPPPDIKGSVQQSEKDRSSKSRKPASSRRASQTSNAINSKQKVESVGTNATSHEKLNTLKQEAAQPVESKKILDASNQQQQHQNITETYYTALKGSAALTGRRHSLSEADSRSSASVSTKVPVTVDRDHEKSGDLFQTPATSFSSLNNLAAVLADHEPISSENNNKVMIDKETTLTSSSNEFAPTIDEATSNATNITETTNSNLAQSTDAIASNVEILQSAISKSSLNQLKSEHVHEPSSVAETSQTELGTIEMTLSENNLENTFVVSTDAIISKVDILTNAISKSSLTEPKNEALPEPTNITESEAIVTVASATSTEQAVKSINFSTDEINNNNKVDILTSAISKSSLNELQNEHSVAESTESTPYLDTLSRLTKNTSSQPQLSEEPETISVLPIAVPQDALLATFITKSKESLPESISEAVSEDLVVPNTSVISDITHLSAISSAVNEGSDSALKTDSDLGVSHIAIADTLETKTLVLDVAADNISANVVTNVEELPPEVFAVQNDSISIATCLPSFPTAENASSDIILKSVSSLKESVEKLDQIPTEAIQSVEVLHPNIHASITDIIADYKLGDSVRSLNVASHPPVSTVTTENDSVASRAMSQSINNLIAEYKVGDSVQSLDAENQSEVTQSISNLIAEYKVGGKSVQSLDAEKQSVASEAVSQSITNLLAEYKVRDSVQSLDASIGKPELSQTGDAPVPKESMVSGAVSQSIMNLIAEYKVGDSVQSLNGTLEINPTSMVTDSAEKESVANGGVSQSISNLIAEYKMGDSEQLLDREKQSVASGAASQSIGNLIAEYKVGDSVPSLDRTIGKYEPIQTTAIIVEKESVANRGMSQSILNLIAGYNASGSIQSLNANTERPKEPPVSASDAGVKDPTKSRGVSQSMTNLKDGGAVSAHMIIDEYQGAGSTISLQDIRKEAAATPSEAQTTDSQETKDLYPAVNDASQTSNLADATAHPTPPKTSSTSSTDINKSLPPTSTSERRNSADSDSSSIKSSKSSKSNKGKKKSNHLMPIDTSSASSDKLQRNKTALSHVTEEGDSNDRHRNTGGSERDEEASEHTPVWEADLEDIDKSQQNMFSQMNQAIKRRSQLANKFTDSSKPMKKPTWSFNYVSLLNAFLNTPKKKTLTNRPVTSTLIQTFILTCFLYIFYLVFLYLVFFFF
jgi:hypothetical protein